MTETHRKVLVALARRHHDDANYRTFSGLMSATGIERRLVRLACRALARRGLARYSNGLWDPEDGTPAGAGYASTDAGYALVEDELDELEEKEWA